MPDASVTPAQHRRLMWIFCAPQGEDLGLSLEAVVDALRLRETGAGSFARIWDRPADGTVGAMSFGIMLDGRLVEGTASVRDQGAAIEGATVVEAVEFAAWLRDSVVPEGRLIMANTRQGLDHGLPDLTVTGRRHDQLHLSFAAHAVGVAQA